jgi:hypothetical protein
MASTPDIWLIIDLRDAYADSDSEELDKLTQNLLEELRGLDEVEKVEQILDPNPPESNMSLGGFLVGILKTQINLVNLRPLGIFLNNRFSSKPIVLEVEANGNKIKLTDVKTEDLDKVVEAAERLLTAAKGQKDG